MTFSVGVIALKSVITVMGKDGVGIIARLSALLAKNSVNIIDITQTTSENQFFMVMVVDMGKATASFSDIAAELQSLGEMLEQKIQVRHKKVYDSMHRI